MEKKCRCDDSNKIFSENFSARRVRLCDAVCIVHSITKRKNIFSREKIIFCSQRERKLIFAENIFADENFSKKFSVVEKFYAQHENFGDKRKILVAWKIFHDFHV
jgi:hypothetical protein